MKTRKRTLEVFFFFVVGLMFLLLVGCPNPAGPDPAEPDPDQTHAGDYDPDGDLDGDGILNKNDSDIDGDGLSNDVERFTHKTSPYLADTDGDGWDDSEEVSNYVAEYPPKFSPLVADLPAIELQLASHPYIHMDYTTNESVEKSYSVETTEELTQSYTT
jgi:hypothetical protein